MVEVAPVAGQAVDADHRARGSRAASVGVAQPIAPVGALDVDAADLHHGSSTAGAAGGTAAGARVGQEPAQRQPQTAARAIGGATHLTAGDARRSLARCPARDPSPLPAASAELSDAERRAEPADVVHPGADRGGGRRLCAGAAAGRADRARHPRPAAAAVPAHAPARPRRRDARAGRDPGRLREPGPDRGQRAPGDRRGDGHDRRARRPRPPPRLAGARQLHAGAGL